MTEAWATMEKEVEGRNRGPAMSDIDSTGARRYSQPMSLPTESILVDQARQGSEIAFGQLVRAHSARIINLAYRLVGDRDEAEDLAQEAFLRLHRSLPAFRGESSLGTWLYRTTTRLAIDHLRRERLKRRLFIFRGDGEKEDPVESAIAPGASPPQALAARQTGERLLKGLRVLSPRQRAIFTLRHFEELPLKEIARILGLEEGTVKAHLHRAVQALRKLLRDLREERS